MNDTSNKIIEEIDTTQEVEIYSIASVESSVNIETEKKQESINNGITNEKYELNDSEIIIEKGSFEIDVPFYEDDLRSKSSQDKHLMDKRQVKTNIRKKLLDDILTSDSISSSIDDISFNNQAKKGPKLTNLVERWGSQTKDLNTEKVNQAMPIIKVPSVENHGIVVDEFPISSPVQASTSVNVKNIVTNEGKQDGALKKKKELFVPLDITSIEDFEDLEFSRIVDDSTSVPVLSTPIKSTKIINMPDDTPVPKINLCIGGLSTQGKIKKIKTKKNSMSFELLKYYINRAEEYTDEDSQYLVSKYQKENKEEFKKVNQNYKNNKLARGTLIMEMSSSLISIFKEKQSTFMELIEPTTLQSSYGGKKELIRFLRRSNSIYDLSNDIYYPADLKILEENVYILYYDAFDFFKEYNEDKIKLYHGFKEYKKSGKNVILTIYNINKLRKGIENLENNQYLNKVQNHLDGSIPKQNMGGRMQEIEKLNMTSSGLDKRLRYIDRSWGVKVHTVTSHLEFINSLPNLLSLIGKQNNDPTIRYMKYAYLHVKSGKDKRDILTKTIHQIGRIPELKAENITRAYPSFQHLLTDFNNGHLKSGLDGKFLMTEAIEKRLFKLFTSNNPNDIL